jgi:hypothetical protein
VHIVETQHPAAPQPTTASAPSAVELRRELADANANCAAADRVAKRAKDIIRSSGYAWPHQISVPIGSSKHASNFRSRRKTFYNFLF